MVKCKHSLISECFIIKYVYMHIEERVTFKDDEIKLIIFALPRTRNAITCDFHFCIRNV